MLIDKNLSDGLALVGLVESPIDLFLRDTDLEKDLTEVLVWLCILDLQGQIKLFLTDSIIRHKNLSQRPF